MNGQADAQDFKSPAGTEGRSFRLRGFNLVVYTLILFSYVLEDGDFPAAAITKPLALVGLGHLVIRGLIAMIDGRDPLSPLRDR